MNSEITNNEEKNEWPKLMESINGDVIVLMISQGRGTVVYPSNANQFGQYHPDWDIANFKDCNRKITLWN